MAKLVYDISGTSTGLATAVNDSIALLQKLQLEVNKLGTGAGLTGLGRAIQDANGQATQLNKTLSDTSLSAKDKGGLAALDALDKKLAIVRGNTELFGDSLKNQQAELGAYQSTLNRLLSLGFEPLDGDVQRIKANIDSLTASIANANAAQIRRPEVSNSLSEATIFNQSAIVPGNVATSGSAALIAEFKKDLDSGKISAAEFNAEVQRINASQISFAKSTASASVQLEEEVGILIGLQTELKALQTAKLTLVNPTDIAKQNALIQELEAEITRFNNVGKVGFDASGNAIKNFGKEADNASKGGVAGFGRGLTSAYGYLRQLAYILPGIGIAGIFNLAFEAIGKLASEIDIFNSKLTDSQVKADAFKEAFASQDYSNAIKSIQELGVNLELAKEGFVDKNKVIDEYNATLGKVTGQVDSLNAAEQGYINNAQKYIQVTLLKAAANAVLNESAKDVADIAEKNQQLQLGIQNAQSQIKALQAVSNPSLNAQDNGIQERINQFQQLIKSNTSEIDKNNKDLKDKTDKRISILLNFNKQQDGILSSIGKNGQAGSFDGTAVSAIAKLQNENADLDFQTQQAKDKNIFDNTSASLSDRLKALADYYDKQKQIITNNASLELSVQGQSATQISNIQKKKYLDLLNADNDYQKKRQEILKSGNNNAFADLSKQLDEIIAKTNNLTQASGLTGYAEQVQKITANYANLNREIDAFIAKTQADVKKGTITQAQGSQLINRANATQQLFAPDEQKQLADAQIAEAQRVANEIQRINNEFGIKADDSLQKQIDGVNKLADQEIAKAKESALTREQIELNYLYAIDRARGNFRGLQAANINYSAQIQQADNAAKTIIQIQQDRATALDKINQDFIQKETDLWNQIQVIDEQAQAEIGDKTSTETGRIQREWESRRLAADKYYQTLLKIAASAGNQDVLGQLPSGGITNFGNAQIINHAQQNIQNAQTNTNTGIDRAELLQTTQAVFGTLTNGITSATRDVFSFFSTFNSETDRSFAALFSGLTSRIEGVFNRIFEDILSKQLNTALINGIADSAGKAQKTLTDSLQKGTKDGTKNLSTQLSSGLTTALAAAGLLGSTISGLTPKTSIVGQGLGGALSGAASGALIGSVIPGIGTVAGGVIGGVVGLVGGIFGASKAQKELQQQQLEQAKEQTAALKASLAYTSQIIGRMTSQGIVTGFSVGATGQLTATVSGKDLQFVLDRNQNGR